MGTEHRGLGPVCHPPPPPLMLGAIHPPALPISTITSCGPRPGRPIPSQRPMPCFHSTSPPSPNRTCTLDVRLGRWAARHPYTTSA
ncbi:hypothetical protein CGRA01v4_04338 [Colletotrichum graminicola]|nr:hypothetical protein CGRA01v4_04338 [Colletotrichum graminicola]